MLDHKDRELRNELASACNELGRELSRLAEFAQWADIVITKAENTGLRGVDTGKRFSRACPAAMLSAEHEQRDPEQYYIGDGLIAQLLADAEAVA